MKILITGQAKTGTTALFSKIKNSVKGARELFEPKKYVLDDSYVWKNEIAKILLYPQQGESLLYPRDGVDYDSFEPFDKKIIIVRDPRDRLISAILYSVRESNFCSDKIKFEKFVSLLKKKEAQPKSVSVSEIISLLDELNQMPSGDFLQGFSKTEQFALKFHDEHASYFVVKYEDFIDGKLDGLAKYIGHSLDGEAAVDPKLNRVERSKGYGSWKSWFLESDCNELNSVMNEYLDRYGYSKKSDLEVNPVINPEHSSDYVIKIANERIRDYEARLQETGKPKHSSPVLSYIKWRFNWLLDKVKMD